MVLQVNIGIIVSLARKRDLKLGKLPGNHGRKYRVTTFTSHKFEMY